jgi:IS1 family transposase
LTANGHPNHRRPRQWLCQACHGFFIETRGTAFYRRREAPEFVRQVLTSVAEGLNVEATARLHRVQVETVETWFALATTHFEQLATYLYRNLQVEQVELDDLFVRLRAVQSSTGSPRRCAWLYNAFDPVTKFWLAFSLGDRSLSTVQHLVHRLVSLLPPGCVPAFLTDGEASFEAALLTHFGHWLPVTPPDQPQASPRRRWLPLPNLHYAQIVKHRRGRRLLYVTPRLVFGQLDQLLSTLTNHGWALSTALIERFNLTLRQHAPALGRRTLALVQSDLTLYRQLILAQTYINFCLPHATLTLPHHTPGRSSVTPAMALGLTDRVWSLEEMLLWRVPPTRPTTLATGG